MEVLAEIAGIIGSEIDSESGTVSITFESTAHSRHTIKIKNVAIGQFLAGLASKPLNKQGQASLHYIIPLRPQGLRPFFMPSGEFGVEFQIAERIGVPILIPEAGIAALAGAAEALENFVMHKSAPPKGT